MQFASSDMFMVAVCDSATLKSKYRTATYYNNILLHILIYSFMIMGIWSQRVCGCTKMSLASSVIKHFYYSYLPQ